MPEVPIVDGHLDLAELSTLFGRDLTIGAADTRTRRLHPKATVSLPDMKAGGVAVALATVTAGFLAADVGESFQPQSALYRTAAEAEAQALRQIACYEAWERDEIVRIVRSVADLDEHLALWREDGKAGLVLVMEGADPIVDVAELPRWWSRGLRGIGLTYGDTKYGTGVAGGSETFKRGGLTRAGVSLLELMAEIGARQRACPHAHRQAPERWCHPRAGLTWRRDRNHSLQRLSGATMATRQVDCRYRRRSCAQARRAHRPRRRLGARRRGLRPGRRVWRRCHSGRDTHHR